MKINNNKNNRGAIDISAGELRKLIKHGQAEIVDVRQKQEYDIIHIKNSKLIPMGEPASRAGEIDWNKQVVFLCRSGSRSRIMANIAAGTGKDVKNLEFGIFECYQGGSGEFLEFDRELVDEYLN